jgi:hypothetical protein
MLTER